MSEMFKIKLPDGSSREMPEGSTPADVAAAIGPGLAKAALAARVNGELRDITRPFEGDSELALVTSRDEKDALELVRHDFAHILAEAVQRLYPGTQITFGPATDDGFYYDFAPAADRGPFTDEDLPAIEEEMRRIIAEDMPLVREVWQRQDVRALFEKQGERFKAEWVMELPEGEPITMYRSGQGEDAWIDLCRGPHLASTGKLDPQAFKLTHVSGAYWRGDQNNPMLSRIYGTAWLSKKQLQEHLVRLEEAAKRDHRKIGREMDLFHLQAEAHGSVFWHPNGFIIWRQLEAYMRRKLDAAGYVEIKTPQLMDARQWEKSGHWGKYRENMFVVPDEVPNTEDEGPVISGQADLDGPEADELPGPCAGLQAGHHQLQGIADSPRRDSAAAIATSRTARSTELCGCASSPRTTPTSSVARISSSRRCGSSAICSTGSTGPRFRPDMRSSSRSGPTSASAATRCGTGRKVELRDAVRAAGRDTEEYRLGRIARRGGVLCAQAGIPPDRCDRPYLAGRHDAVGPVLPERLDAIYIGEDGEKHRPIMLHRAILGTFERFIGILIEHHAGKFPLWLAPVQAVVATIVSDADDYAREVVAKLAGRGPSREADLRNEKINYKVREHSLAKVPLLLVVGKREAEEGTVAVRRLGSDEHQKVMSLDEAVALFAAEALPPDLRRRDSLSRANGMTF